MRNIKLNIEYDGTDYCGWQSQGHKDTRTQGHPSIQETIERVLSKILQEKIRLTASGRTDAGVHAHRQVANFKTDSRISLKKLQYALNSLLPKDIVVAKAQEAKPNFHSRFDAKSKIYRYAILNAPYMSAFLRNKVYFYPYPLDIRLMRKESRCLLGKHDFKAFCASGSSAKTTTRTIKKISIAKRHCTLYHVPCTMVTIDIEADGFLYNMVRSIAGTLMQIGNGRFQAGILRKILISLNRKLAGPTAPACGLYLLTVKY